MTVKHTHKPKIKDSFAHLHEYRSVERNMLKLTMTIRFKSQVLLP
jgi:hypothetical protein